MYFKDILLEKYQRIKNFILQNLALTITLAILLIVLTIVYILLDMILPDPINDIVFWIIVYYLGRLICRYMTFPGSSWLWRRYVENHFCRALSDKSLMYMQCLVEVIEALQKKKNPEILKNSHKIQILEIKKMIKSFNFTFSKQRSTNTITKYQLNLMKKLLLIENLLNETFIKCIHTNTYLSIWELIDETQLFFNLIKNTSLNASVEPPENGDKILQSCSAIIDELEKIVNNFGFIHSIKTWLFNDSLGTIEQIRIELENRYNTQRIFLTSYDGTLIDCLFVFGKQMENISQYDSEMIPNINIKNPETGSFSVSQENKSSDIGPTIIYCNPNAGYYEYMYYKSDWLEYYVQNGINVFLWNYRGYGNTKGTPLPHKLLRDSEIIFDFLKTNMNLKKIGLHGESLGGMIASHIAQTRAIDFVCIDRTFDSLYKVARYSYGIIIGTIYYIIVLWSQNNSKKYIQAQTYKVLTVDPRDTIIPLESSLCINAIHQYIGYQYEADKNYGKEIRISGLTSTTGTLYKYMRKVFWRFVKLRNYFNERYENEKIKNFISRYYQVYVVADDSEKLIEALQRISKVAIEMSKIKSNNNNNLISKRSSRISGTSDNIHQILKETLKHQENGTKRSVDSSFDMSSFPERDDSLLNDTKLQYLKKIGNNHPHDKLILDELEEQHSQKIANQNLQEMQKVEDYAIIINDEDLQSDELQSFIIKVFTAFEILDSFGLTINDIFMNYNNSQSEQLFKKFVIGLEIWGSYLPLKVNLKKKSLESDFHQRLAFLKIRAMIKKLEQILQEQKSCSMNQISFNILLDIKFIIKCFNEIKSKLEQQVYIENKKSQNIVNSGSSSGINTENSNPKFALEFETSNNKKAFFDKSNILEEEKQEIQKMRKQYHDLRQKIMGNLIILSCGHNGVFSKDEVSLYEMHLQQAGFLQNKETQLSNYNTHKQ